jgi:hypothetical protein
MMTTCDNHDVDDGNTTTVEPVAAAVAAMVAPTVTPPPLPLTATMATPRGPSTSTPGLAPFRCGLVSGGGGQRTTTSSVIHVGWHSPL